MTDSACLAGYTAADGLYDYIKLSVCICNCEWLTNDNLECLETEILINILAVDCNLALAGYETYTSYCILAAAGAIVINCCFFAIYVPSD